MRSPGSISPGRTIAFYLVLATAMVPYQNPR